MGVDASGKFETGSGFEPATVGAAVAPEYACDEVAEWIRQAAMRWGRDDLKELHAADLDWTGRLEACEMLAARDDVRLAVVATDQLLLGSAEAVALHRRRQRDHAIAQPDPGTTEGKERLDALSSLLGNPRFLDHEYVLAAVLPLVVIMALQQALCYFRLDDWRGEMDQIKLLIDEETPKTVRYCVNSLLPVLGGDPRFSVVIPDVWRERPIHPLLARALHPDGDGLRPQELLPEVAWVPSIGNVIVQLADMAAWVVRRAVVAPHEDVAQRCFELLAPLLEGEHGNRFDLFSVPAVKAENLVLYEHLLRGEQPEWWLMRPGTASSWS